MPRDLLLDTRPALLRNVNIDVVIGLKPDELIAIREEIGDHSTSAISSWVNELVRAELQNINATSRALEGSL